MTVQIVGPVIRDRRGLLVVADIPTSVRVGATLRDNAGRNWRVEGMAFLGSGRERGVLLVPEDGATADPAPGDTLEVVPGP